ncbi:MAG TPA: hypothetical protein VF488_01510 [Gemmatimonadaceae bacterium]
MTLRAKFGWTIAAVSVIVNAGGAVYALLRQEWMHGGTHAALLALTLYLVVLLRPGARRTFPDTAALDDEPLQPASLGDARMEQLQQSVDAIAIEVERIGEAQRFNAKLAAKQGDPSGERR